MGHFKCEKYSLKCEILDENSKFPIYFTTLLSYVLYVLTISMDQDVHTTMYRLGDNIQVYLVPLKFDKWFL